jgi:ribosomal protein L27
MAHKKGGGSSRNGRDSNSQRLGAMDDAQAFVHDSGFEDVTIRKTNLEDVFVELTGKKVGDQK